MIATALASSTKQMDSEQLLLIAVKTSQPQLAKVANFGISTAISYGARKMLSNDHPGTLFSYATMSARGY